MNILFNNIKKEMEREQSSIIYPKDEKPIKKVESNLNKMIEDIECIKKDIAEIFTILHHKETKKDPPKENGSWFLF